MALQTATLDGVICVVDSSAPTVPLLTMGAAGGTMAAHNAGALRDLKGPRVLRFAGDVDATHVNCGPFWPVAATDLGSGFLYDAIVVSRTGGYVISAGHGGAHPILWTIIPGPGGGQSGNLWDGDSTVSFGGTYAPAVGECVYICVHWDGVNIYTYSNGICDGITPFAGPRMSVGTEGDVVAYLGGSDHSVWSGDLIFFRCWDSVDPRPDHPAFPYIPERHPSRYANPGVPCDLYIDVPSCAGGMTLYDSSPAGKDHGLGYPVRHDGFIYNASPLGAEQYAFSPQLRSGDVLPEWVAFPDCPLGRAVGTTPAPTGATYTIGTPPVGCLVHDGFQRANSTLAFQASPGLGSTEGGSLGPLPWNVGIVGGYATSGTFGRLGGMAAPLNIGYMVAWVPLGTPDHIVQSKRLKATAFLGATGVACRVVDASNYYAAYYEPSSSSSGTVKVTKMVGGTPTNLQTTGSVVDDGSFTHLRMTAIGTEIKVYKGDGSSWTQVGATLTGQTDFQASQNAGFTNNSGSANWTSLIRWDDFTAFTGS